MRLLPHPATEDIELTEVLRALSDPVRLQIALRLSVAGEMNCTTAGDDLGVHKSTASHHYRTLREAGVVLTKQEGRLKYMSLRRADLETRFPGLLDAVLSAAALHEAQAARDQRVAADAPAGRPSGVEAHAPV
ncbi:ArsR/SmtB family transcription factor [Nonomuraea candida]|uniref:ArsR/SmtB family transcription factor n=1 Tax=Nonomuraea candida TaxID=359159 RepID=UPI0007C7E613|nr:helix-turn-helix transcriptional regulator [Nonomuraea candida]